jgi:hypothetical protein
MLANVAVWYMGGAQGNTFLGRGGWTLMGTADLNGDSKPDLVWQNDEMRQLVAWYGSAAEGNSYLAGTGGDSRTTPSRVGIAR